MWEPSCDQQFSQSIFSTDGSLCAAKKRPSCHQVPQLCVRDSKGLVFFFISSSGSFMGGRCHVEHCKWVTGTQSHLLYLRPFQSLFIERSPLKGSESMLSMLFFCKTAKNLQEKCAFVNVVWIWSTNSFTFALTADQQFQERRNKKFECFKFYIAPLNQKLSLNYQHFTLLHVWTRSFAHGHRGAVGCYVTQDGASDPQYLWCFPPCIQERTAFADRRRRELHEWVASEGMTLLSDLVSTGGAHTLIRCGNSIGHTTIATVLFPSCHIVCTCEVIKRFWQCVKLLFPGK